MNRGFVCGFFVRPIHARRGALSGGGTGRFDHRGAARLLSQRLVLTEVVRSQELGRIAASGRLSPRSLMILSYTLCGFADTHAPGPLRSRSHRPGFERAGPEGRTDSLAR